MKKLLPLITLLWLLWLHISAQNNPDLKRTWHWYFGDKAGLDFSSGNPVAVTNGQMSAVDGTVSISDTSGNLLFYSNGYSVWNRNHQIMPNGTGLVGPYGSSGYKQIIAVPQPDYENIYYLFSWEYDSTYIQTRETYAIIDMNHDGGLGDVISKRNFLMNGVSQKRAAVMHKNQKDIWIVIPKFGTNAYYSFLLTNTGINTNPVISNAGVVDLYSRYRMKFSPDGSLLVNGIRLNGIVLLKFDNSTGIVYDYINLSSIFNSEEFGFEFSPDGKKLYCSVYTAITNPLPVNTHNAIYQISLNGDSASIMNSRVLLDTNETIDNGQMISLVDGYSFGLQKGSDGKIYSSKVNKPYLGCINTPNNSGISCNYIDSAVYLNNKICGVGLPYFLSNWFFSDTLTTVVEFLNETKTMKIYPNPIIEKAIVEIFDFNEVIIKADIEIFDLLGKRYQINYSIISQNDNNMKLLISTGLLSSSIYILKVTINQNIYSQKIIITK